MLILGHVGITLGAGWLAAVAARRSSENPPAGPDSPGSAAPGISPARRFFQRLDLRLLVIGGLLPDLIDKPLSLIQPLAYGRTIAHTLLFLLIITAIGLWFHYKRSRDGALFLSFGVLVHLLLDQIWFEPGVFLWPLPGWQFPAGHFSTSVLVYGLLTDPAVYLPEIAGGIVCCLFVIKLRKRHRIPAFVRTGRW